MPKLESGNQPREVSQEKEQLAEKVNTVLLNYVKNAIIALNPPVRKGESKQVIASVPGRPEDEQLAIDSFGEHILTGIIRDNQVSAFVFGEHNDYNLGNGETQVFFVIDSFDNTSQYKRGLDTSVYTVVSAYDKDGNVFGTVIGDIKDEKAYVSVNGKNFLLDIRTGEKKQISKSTKTTIKDPQITIATYDGSNEYSVPFDQFFSQMKKNMAPKGVKYGGGGSYIYGLMASGAVDAYVMFAEPYSEIFTGLPIAQATGCTAVSVDLETGQITELKFEPERMRQNPELYKNGTVPLFIAAATPELRDEIIKYYLEAKVKIAEEKERQRLLEEFAGGRRIEFEIFKASQKQQNPSNN